MQIMGFAKKASIALLALIAAFAVYVGLIEPRQPKDITYRFGSPALQSSFLEILQEKKIPYELSENVRGETTVVVHSLDRDTRDQLEQRMRPITAEFDRKTVPEFEQARKP